MEVALPLESVDFDKSVEATGDISNMTAEEYLSWVRYQSEQLPLVSRAEIDVSVYAHKQTPYMPVVESILSECGDKDSLPAAEWQHAMLNKFSELRNLFEVLQSQSLERVVTVPPLKNRISWVEFCFGAARQETDASVDTEREIKRRKMACAQLAGIDLSATSADRDKDGNHSDHDNDDEDNDARSCDSDERQDGGSRATITLPYSKNVAPTISLVLQFDQVLTQRVLGYLIEHCQNETRISLEQGAWLYTLLARLEKPLHQDMAALIRELYRICCRMRHILCSDSNSATQDRDELIASLNVLIAITGSYFGQGEEFATSSSSGPYDAMDDSAVDVVEEEADEDGEDEDVEDEEEEGMLDEEFGGVDGVEDYEGGSCEGGYYRVDEAAAVVSVSVPRVAEFSTVPLHPQSDEVEDGEIM
jgi:survival of motor neuron protein-interacting protein 1